MGEHVLARRAELGLTQAEAAERAGLGVSGNTWRHVEHGQPARSLTLAKISKALGWPADTLDRIADGGDPPTEPAPPDESAEPDWSLMAQLDERLKRLSWEAQDLVRLASELRRGRRPPE